MGFRAAAAAAALVRFGTFAVLGPFEERLFCFRFGAECFEVDKEEEEEEAVRKVAAEELKATGFGIRPRAPPLPPPPLLPKATD